jgi:hypothetical protein
MKNNNVVTNFAQDFDDTEKRQGRENIDAAKTVQVFTSSGSFATSGDVQIIGDTIYVGSTSVGHLVDDLDKYYLASNPSGFITSADLNGYATQEWVEDYVSGFGPAGTDFSAAIVNYTSMDPSVPIDGLIFNQGANEVYADTNGDGQPDVFLGNLVPATSGAVPGQVLTYEGSGQMDWTDPPQTFSAKYEDVNDPTSSAQLEGIIFQDKGSEIIVGGDEDGDGDIDHIYGSLMPSCSGAAEGQVLGMTSDGLGWINQQGGGTGGTPIYDKSNTTVQVSGMTFDHSTSNGLYENEIFVNENGSNVSMGLTVPTAGRASGKILSVTNGTGALGWINQPKIPVTSAFITAADLAASGYAPAEQSDWTEENTSDLAYIKNKPVESWLQEGTNVWFTENSAGLIINASGGSNSYIAAGSSQGPVYTPIERMNYWSSDRRVTAITSSGTINNDLGYLSPWSVPNATSANYDKVLGWTSGGAAWVPNYPAIGRNLWLNQNFQVQTNLPGGEVSLEPEEYAQDWTTVGNLGGAYSIVARYRTEALTSYVQVGIRYLASGYTSHYTFVGTQTVGTGSTVNVKIKKYINTAVVYTPQQIGDSLTVSGSNDDIWMLEGTMIAGSLHDFRCSIWYDSSDSKYHVAFTAVEVGKVGATN